ncbi:CBS domain-containing protein [Pseudoxanthobacter soli DSM 19599]|uniref:CBS domain-containing protein n=1 Tax=Pseudoxanthobacter soli DSM 19599 TaxID=1123029 RepID=A0A1M7ZC85_9HYPH|nr:CBS domain-containing protein [Pseudoxanthobacter soli]SHO62521.1 CBS domain-containing protein [Pseudoxanthobacter soli DSM 19599]
MTVAAILAKKGRDIATIDPEATIAEVCDLLAARHIGAVIVVRGEAIAGIISERDIVRALSSAGASVLDHRVSDHMTRAVETATESQTVTEVMERMTARRFRHMPVVRDGRLVGVVSIGDVVKHRIAQAEDEAESMRNYITMV